MPELAQIKSEIVTLIHNHNFAAKLAQWIKPAIETNPQWRTQFVKNNIDFRDYERITDNNPHFTLTDLDPTLLIRIIVTNYYEVQNFKNLRRADKNTIYQMRDVRNRWSHISANEIEPKKIKFDVDIMFTFFSMINAPDLAAKAKELGFRLNEFMGNNSRLKVLPHMPKFHDLDREQQKIANKTFKSPAYISGVSGSGKTSILIHRAIRMADDEPEKPILITTLNRTLAHFIKKLLLEASDDDAIFNIIEVKSMFELCQEYLFEFDPKKKKWYSDVTWKNDQHVDEIWREFYRCEVNNDDAFILFDIHKRLNANGINGEMYMRQEFDLIRSEFPLLRNDYKNFPRKGRQVSFKSKDRDNVLRGLFMWEKKMEDIGVMDHLGLSQRLFFHKDKLNPKYSHILIDEAQDFGTIELQILRCLVEEDLNDIILFGDKAQTVLHKSQNISSSGVNIGAQMSITKNRRNTKEILEAANVIFRNAIEDTEYSDEGILNPELSEVSHLKPLICKANGDEISYAINYIHEFRERNPSATACIALAGYSWLEIDKFARQEKLTTLDSNCDVSSAEIFVSDLEQTKGYEFDVMIIANCKDNIIPSKGLPPEEIYQDACKLYVAMTRAKSELLISRRGRLSEWFEDCEAYFETDNWEDVVSKLSYRTKRMYPKRIPQIIDRENDTPESMKGRRFVYSDYATGLPMEDQEKIVSLVGSHKKCKWRNIGQMCRDNEALSYISEDSFYKIKDILSDQGAWD